MGENTYASVARRVETISLVEKLIPLEPNKLLKFQKLQKKTYIRLKFNKQTLNEKKSQ